MIRDLFFIDHARARRRRRADWNYGAGGSGNMQWLDGNGGPCATDDPNNCMTGMVVANFTLADL